MSTVICRIVLAAGMTVAVYTDCRWHKIYNVLSVSMAICGLLIHMSEGPNALLFSLKSLAVGLAIGIILWILHLIRAGDAKLLAAISSLMGWLWMLNCLCWSLVAGALIGCIVLIRKGELRSRMRRVKDYLFGMLAHRSFWTYRPAEGTEGELPFAISLAIGCLLTFVLRIF